MATKKAATKKTDSDGGIELDLRFENLTFCVVGMTPYICNALKGKSIEDLLYPPKKKRTDADKAEHLKHDPIREFWQSIYTSDDGPTYIVTKGGAWGNALRAVAKDTPGASKAEIGRKTFVKAGWVPIYGKPELLMSNVRQAGMQRTPDVRTRAIIPEWAAEVTVTYEASLLNQKTVISLFAAAGYLNGMGDWRSEKGDGSYGMFEVREPNDPDFKRIVKYGGREAQIAAMNAACPHDDFSAKSCSWFYEEVERRGDTKKLWTPPKVA